jgi:alpha-beta hydrolase superfamily lysophospholipase
MPLWGSPSTAHRDVSFVTADGLTLEGWLFEPQGSSQGLVVFLHGKDANRGHFAGDAKRFTARGYTVLAYDQRAHGRSEGQWCTFGHREVPDLQLAIDRFAQGRPVYVIGESMGAAVALEAAAQDARIAGVVAGAAFSDLRTVVNEHRPAVMSTEQLALAVAEAERRADFHVDDINPARDASHIAVPTLLLHGSEDPYIPLQHAYRIRQNLTGPAQLVTLEGVQHIDVLLHEEAWQVIEHWFDAVSKN